MLEAQNRKIIMNQGVNLNKKRILIAPLDWGLGHATRCIPIIRELLAAGYEVLLGATGKSAILLQAEFPHLTLLPLPGYGITYSKKKWSFISKVIAQIPKIQKAIKAENKWLQQTVLDHRIDAVISDNRYGLYHSLIPCFLVTHQLALKTGFGAFADRIVQKKLYKYVNKFKECWVPDAAEGITLAGDLSHPKILPNSKVSYIHYVSRFRASSPDGLTYYILILLSGPEPQRSVLEAILLRQANELKEPVFFVRGLPGDSVLPEVPNHITIVNHLPTQAMQPAMDGASYVVCRSGYSSVMDVVRMQKKAIMIPTPGQTEQEYLALHLMQNNIALCLPQSKFQLKNALSLAATFPYKMEPVFNNDLLKKAVASIGTYLQGADTNNN